METKTLHRLVGGLVLLGVGVVFLPMVFDGSGAKEELRKRVAIPNQPEAVRSVQSTDLRAPSPSATSAAAVAQPSAPAPTRVLEPVSTPGPTNLVIKKTPVAAPEPEPQVQVAVAAPKPAPEPSRAPVKIVDAAARVATPAKSASRGWTVQVGSFASAKNAQGLAEKMRGDGISAFVSEKRGSNGATHRVLVGPYPKQSEAAVVKKQVLKRYQIQGFVVSYQP